MDLFRVKKIIQTNSVDTVNTHLEEGWILLKIFPKKCETIFVLGFF